MMEVAEQKIIRRLQCREQYGNFVPQANSQAPPSVNMCCGVRLQVIDPLRSRCLCVRVPAPTHAEVEHVLQHVAQTEQIQLPGQLRQRIAQVTTPLANPPPTEPLLHSFP